jgi:hypothetical protein
VLVLLLATVGSQLAPAQPGAPGGDDPAAGAEAAAWPPALALAGPDRADPALQDHLASDRQWLAEQRATPLLAPAAADTAALRAWLQRAGRARDGAAGAAGGAGGQRGGNAAADTTGPPGASRAAADAAPYGGHRDVLARLRDRWLERGHLGVSLAVSAGSAGNAGNAGNAGEDPRAPRVTVTPGPVYTLAAISVGGDPFDGRGAILRSQLPRAGDAFRPPRYAAAAGRVVAACAERGFPFPVWLTRAVTLDHAAATVTVEAVLLPGPRAVVGPQDASLASRRAARFTVRAAGVPSGSRFRESDLARGRDRLLARDLYARVDAPLVHVTSARDTVGILWRVEPLDRPNRLGVVLGLSQQEEGGSRLSGQVDLELPNLAGTGRSLRAGWSDDGQQRATFGFEYHEPLVLGSPLDTDLALRSEVQQDVYNRFTVTSNWQLPVVAFWGLEAGVGWDRTTYPAGDLERSRRLRGRLAVLHARGDRTRSGWSGTFAVETARRRTTLRGEAAGEADGDAATDDLGREDTQRLLEVDLAGELWLRRALSLAARASFRQLETDARPAPLDELYRFGGATTLRGYREDQFRGETAAWGGVEVRLGRPLRARVYTFLDVGYFERSRREETVADGAEAPVTTTSDTRVGFGLGLLTAAAAGRLNLAVGFPGDVDFATAKLHVSLLGSF